MTLYLSSPWAEEEMKGLQEDKNIGKGNKGGMEGTMKFWTRAQRHYNEYEKSGAEENEEANSNATRDGDVKVTWCFTANNNYQQ